MSKKLNFIMISAMYENGGNFTQRFFDAHPELFVYPFESQLGTNMVNDRLSSLFPLKYRWPVFPIDGTFESDYKMIIDEEVKVRARTPYVSKFRSADMNLSDEHRLSLFLDLLKGASRTRAKIVEAFFRATFMAWKNYVLPIKKNAYLGYSPIIVVDADKIIADFPDAHIIHVVRNPWSAYADTKKRAVPLSLSDYLTGWTITQYHALLFQKKFPRNVHIVLFEDIIKDPVAMLGRVSRKCGLAPARTLSYPSWNGELLNEAFPWGTLRKADHKTNLATANELSKSEKTEIALRAEPYLGIFGYRDFI